MSYAKVLLILANIFSTEITLNPPTPGPPLKDHELQKYAGKETVGTMYVKLIPKLSRVSVSSLYSSLFWSQQAAFWIVGLGEIGLIAASHFPDDPMSKRLLSFVPNPSGASSIGVSQQYLIGTACLVTGALIRWFAYRAMGRMFTFSLTIRDDHRLITDGPYSVVRHPSYTGTILHYIGTVLTCFAAGTFITTCGVLNSTVGQRLVYGSIISYGMNYLAVVSRVVGEDNMLKNQFGPKWDEWAKRVPYRLVPLIFWLFHR
jgi:protein-S-isoprenylcysteine O-methyltransferase Ste14